MGWVSDPLKLWRKTHESEFFPPSESSEMGWKSVFIRSESIFETKAGKSTLHSILTEQGWDAIGVGKQRTTRSNRFYTWNNIRIIDTPGIGAPGGKSDEEIAESISQFWLVWLSRNYHC